MDRLRRQATRYGVQILPSRAEGLKDAGAGRLTAAFEQGTITADSVLLATGADEVQAPVADLDGAIRRGIVRHCPTCDAYDVRDRRVGILGRAKCRFQEVMLLRSYTCDLTVLSLGRQLEIADHERAELQACGVELVDEPVAELVPEAEGYLRSAGAKWSHHPFRHIYTALGCAVDRSWRFASARKATRTAC